MTECIPMVEPMKIPACDFRAAYVWYWSWGDQAVPFDAWCTIFHGIMTKADWWQRYKEQFKQLP